MSNNNPPPSVSGKSRFSNLLSTIRVDKVTVSFSIEDRDFSGRKKGAFVCLTASRGAGGTELSGTESESPTGYTLEEARVVRLALSREVVKGTYDDAFRRGVIPKNQDTVAEVKSIVDGYDGILSKITTGE